MSKVSLSALVALVACCLPIAAQQGRGTILGTVTDSSGAAVPGARVVVTNAGTNFSFEAETSQEGFYTTPAIPVGAYTVAVESNGFKKTVRSGIDLRVDDRAQVNFSLEVGSVSESVEVSAQADLVDTSTGTLGKVIENRRVVDLPVNGRSAFALAQLAPAVKSTYGNNQGFLDRGLAVSLISINGGPAPPTRWRSMAEPTIRPTMPMRTSTPPRTPSRSSRSSPTLCPPSSALPSAASST